MVRMPKVPDGWFDAETGKETSGADMGFARQWDDFVPMPGGLLDGLSHSDVGSTLHWLVDSREIGKIPGLPQRVYDEAAKDVRRLLNETASTSKSEAGAASTPPLAAAYDGVCRMPDGSDHPYIDTGGGFGEIYGAGNPNTNGQFGIGEAANGTTAPISSKPGGLAGGGKSGPVTSPASRAARGLTGSAKLPELGRISPTLSVGGTISRAMPFLGAPMMWFDVLEHQNAPNCIPIVDPTKIY